MNVKDAEAIKHAIAIKDYCCERTDCQNCVFVAKNGLCNLEKSLAVDWELPHMKTYKDDFLEKFPTVKFDAILLLHHEIKDWQGTVYCGRCAKGVQTEWKNGKNGEEVFKWWVNS